ncbi:MAG TPA: SpoIID/LytB domain-containing protein [Solirubrobacteraceae bacterium]|nr:SpoIID/LytB domain-containing protein [Solirubrobacteraceae bacterium]
MRSVTPPPYLTVLAKTLASARRALPLRVLRAALTAAVVLLAIAAGARGASVFYIRGGGDGHGIGMSQYGAEGYALHGADYRSILAHYFPGTALATIGPQRTVRVLLGTGPASFSGATAAAGVRLQPASTYEVTTAGGKLRLRTGAGQTLGPFTAPLIVSGPGPLHLSGHGSYRGSLQFAADGSGGVQIVDAVGLDDYVRGVVAEEMPASWAPAALEAQAVAARTYAVTTTVRAGGYDLYDDSRSQVYGGVGAETGATDAAVAATGGQIVTYNGTPAVTYFFSSSGGYTESIQDAWPGATPEPWLRGVPDPYDGAAGNPSHSWGAQMSLAAASAKLRGLVKGSLIGIRVVRRGVSPRMIAGTVVGTRGQTTVSGAQLQSVFGLDSTLAAFTTITTQDPRGRLSGTIFPPPGHGAVAVQAFTGGRWRTVAHAGVSAAGGYGAMEPAGRYRIVDGSLTGPVVTVP